MSARRTERLLNLVICLLATRRYLGVDAIRRAVPGYDAENDEAFRRMFERDKEELRELGIPLETGSNSVWEDEIGYRIARRDYELPAIDLAPDEAAAVGLAARLWSSAQLAEAASSGLLKLRAGGTEAVEPSPDLEPRVEASDPALPALLDAVRTGTAVKLTYRTGGGGQPRSRHIDPWGVLCWHGRWYLAGYDHDREAARVFRVDRILGPVRTAGRPGAVVVPADVDVRAMVREFGDDRPAREATLRVRRGAGAGLRRAALRVTPGSDGFDEVAVGFSDPARLAQWVAAFGDDVVVCSPPDAREAIIAHLSALAAT